MNGFGCSCKCTCTVAAAVASAIIGVLAAFLQITGVITVATPFLWVALGIAVVYLGGLTVTTALMKKAEQFSCLCPALRTALTGILGTILFSVILLAVGITATSIVSAILVGLLVFFLALLLTGTACLVKAQAGCDR